VVKNKTTQKRRGLSQEQARKITTPKRVRYRQRNKILSGLPQHPACGGNGPLAVFCHLVAISGALSPSLHSTGLWSHLIRACENRVTNCPGVSFFYSIACLPPPGDPVDRALQTTCFWLRDQKTCRVCGVFVTIPVSIRATPLKTCTHRLKRLPPHDPTELLFFFFFGIVPLPPPLRAPSFRPNGKRILTLFFVSSFFTTLPGDCCSWVPPHPIDAVAPIPFSDFLAAVLL